MLRQWVLTSLWRAWLGFAGLMVLGFIAFLIADHDNPLHSDDPYIAGFLLGGIAAVMSVVYSIAEKVLGNRWWATLFYSAIVCLWAILVVAATANSNEGKDVGKVIAIASLVLGVICWPLYAFRVPRSLGKILTAGALTAVAMYGVVAVRMAMSR